MRCLPLLLLLGCPKSPSALGDPSLPEAVAEVEAQDPQGELEQAAASMDPGLRARALHLIVRTTPDLDIWAPRALFDPSPWVQRGALEALAARPDEGADDLRSFAERDGSEPIARALAALELAPGSVDLSQAWREAVAPWDRAPLALAAWHHGDEEARDGLAAALETGELPLDLELMDALVLYGDAQLTEPLRRAQDRVEPELATAIAAARLQLGDPKAEVPLRKALGGDVHERMEVLDRLATVPSEAAEGLIRKAQAGGPDLVRTHAQLLLTARTAQQPQRLSEAMDHVDREVRLLGVHAAAQALRHGPANRALARTALSVLEAGTTDEDPSVRAAAARGLGEHGGGEHQAKLEPLLGDEVQAVRVEAAGALLR